MDDDIRVGDIVEINTYCACTFCSQHHVAIVTARRHNVVSLTFVSIWGRMDDNWFCSDLRVIGRINRE